MTLHDLDVVPNDVSATALGYRIDTEPAPEWLVATTLRHPRYPGVLRLSILGASHAVTLVVNGRDTVTEEVSCRSSTSSGALPDALESRPGPWGTHHMTCSFEAMSPAGFTTLVEELTSRADRSREVLAGRFPGAYGALTVVVATAVATGWEWRTWHLYPERTSDGSDIGGEVVTTVSSLDISLVDSLSEVGA